MKATPPEDGTTEWKLVEPGSRYYVSNSGLVWDSAYGRLKKALINYSRGGYLYVTLNSETKGKKPYVHKLVLEAFVGLRPEGYECRHLDGNPQNNKLENLAWGTSKENHQDTKDHGGYLTGEDNPAHKLTKEQVLEIRSLQKVYTPSKLADMFHIHPMHVYKILKREYWKNI